MEVIYEDGDVLVAIKPAGVPVQTKNITGEDMESALKRYLSGKGEDPREAGIVHRLDTPVAGLIVFGKNKKALSFLDREFRERRVSKSYLAVVSGLVTDEGEVRLADHIRKESGATGVRAVISDEKDKRAKRAELRYSVIANDPGKNTSVLRVSLDTGRFHQIRCQLSHAGHPILGDVKYGYGKEEAGKHDIPKNIKYGYDKTPGKEVREEAGKHDIPKNIKYGYDKTLGKESEKEAGIYSVPENVKYGYEKTPERESEEEIGTHPIQYIYKGEIALISFELSFSLLNGRKAEFLLDKNSPAFVDFLSKYGYANI